MWVSMHEPMEEELFDEYPTYRVSDFFPVQTVLVQTIQFRQSTSLGRRRKPNTEKTMDEIRMTGASMEEIRRMMRREMHGTSQRNMKGRIDGRMDE